LASDGHNEFGRVHAFFVRVELWRRTEVLHCAVRWTAEDALSCHENENTGAELEHSGRRLVDCQAHRTADGVLALPSDALERLDNIESRS